MPSLKEMTVASPWVVPPIRSTLPELIYRYVTVRAPAGKITLNGLYLVLQDERLEGVGLDPGGRGLLTAAVPLVNADDVQSVHGLTGAHHGPV
jgi:hypothetical protein